MGKRKRISTDGRLPRFEKVTFRWARERISTNGRLPRFEQEAFRWAREKDQY